MNFYNRKRIKHNRYNKEIFDSSWLINNNCYLPFDLIKLIIKECHIGYYQVLAMTCKLFRKYISTLCVYINPTINIASKDGHLNLVKWLISQKSPVNRALQYSCKSGNLELVKYIRSITKGWTGKAICNTIKYGNLDIFKFLIENKMYNDIKYYKELATVYNRNEMMVILKSICCK